MSASQTTTNYNLPVFEPTDIPAWLTDWNSAMGDIDTAIAGAKTAADTAQLTASGAANGVSTLNTTVGNLQTTVGNQGSTITSLGNSLNTVQSLIGNGTPTTTDQTIIGAINEINAAYKDAANIEFDNTGTGMTATNVQAAIVEAYNHGGSGGASAAEDVTYNNTTSGLTASNVQDAIDEVEAEIQALPSRALHEVASVTADGVKTTGVLLDELYQLIPSGGLSHGATFEYVTDNGNSTVHQLRNWGPGRYFFTSAITTNADWSMSTMVLKSDGCKNYYCASGTTSDSTSSVLTSGIKLSIFDI